jgi:OmpA-OmpF porin, OOP family
MSHWQWLKIAPSKLYKFQWAAGPIQKRWEMAMKKQLIGLGIAALLAGAAQAATMPEKELGLLLGGTWIDEDAVGNDDQLNPTFGIRYGQRLGTSTNFFTDLTYTPFSWEFGSGTRQNPRINGDGDLYTLRGGLEWLFSQQQKYNWFLAGGLGAMHVDMDNGGPDFTRPLLSVGVGQAWEVGLNDAFRWEVRADQSFGNDSLPSSSLTNVQALLGYSWGLGAPLDSDGDGVIDRRDQCPNTPKGAKVDAKGCPIDSDGDGVFDGLDMCPDTPKNAKVDSQGCPLDSDGDGVPDYKDKCPNTPKGEKVNADGCPIDTDGDGVVDSKDACPAVFAQTADGCPPPPPAPEPKKLTLEGVNFDNDKDTLRPEALGILNAAAVTLKEWGDVKVEVAGHTDSMNGDDYYLKLSQRRANTVRDYLIKMGIAAERLSAKGYGESQPVADNGTEEGRFKNRRVELIPQQ